MKPKIDFSSLSDAEKQAWADFSLHELHRHTEDIQQIREELEIIRNKYGIYPRRVYVGVWLEVK